MRHQTGKKIQSGECFDPVCGLAFVNGFGRPLNSILIRDILQTLLRDTIYRASFSTVPVVGGSDTHHPFQVGTVLNHLFDECETAADIKNAINGYRYEIILSPWVQEKNRLARVMKKVIKKIKKI